MPHNLVVGITMSGKSTLCKWIADGLKKKGLKVAVLDPMQDEDWKADYLTNDPEKFLRYAKTHKDHILFVDEGGSAIGKYNEPMEWLATTSRHLGHSSFFICHRTTQLSTTLRYQCGRCYLFCVDNDEAIRISEDFNKPAVANEGPSLPKLQFLIIPKWGEIQRCRLDFSKRQVMVTK